MYYLPPFNCQLTFDLSLARKWIAPPSKQKMPRFVKEQVAERCMGCKAFGCTGPEVFTCIFANTGYRFNSLEIPACGVQYHQLCFTVPAIFPMRHSKGLGQTVSGDLSHFPFICEACSVQAQLGRPISNSAND